MKILWVSKHKPLPSQIAELNRLFKSVEVIIDSNPFADAVDIRNRFISSGCNEMVLVAPLTVCKRICELGIYPLWAEMKLVACDSSEVETEAFGNRERLKQTRRCFKFIKFRRLKGINLDLEELS